MANELSKLERIALISQAFTPATPVNHWNLFSGRSAQLQDVVSAVSQPGLHVGLYGERGVGKTSMANVLPELLAEIAAVPILDCAFVTCSTETDFDELWRNIYREIEIDPPPLDVRLTPEDVRYDLSRHGEATLIVIDELDRMDNEFSEDSRSALADTIKTLSDHAVNATLIMVGVAHSIGDLIGEHESIVRALLQIEMPRMSRVELRRILEQGCERAKLKADDEAIEKIVSLSEGLPHYAHLLGLHTGQLVVQDGRERIRLADINAAVPQAVARHTLKDDYLKAIRSAHTDNLYEDVLLACALAPKNQLGYFTSGAVRDPLEQIAGRRIEIPQFARHIGQFQLPERGNILRRTGEPRRYFYRFEDPIMQPYIILNALSTGLLTDEQLAEIQNRFGSTLTPDDAVPTEPQRLF